ncbi:MAG: carbohydrate ABC transporter permease [Actinomycetaceae bacterium]|nr:carbohydrate ABC transporter permease [Actinomycetaceae bacterium]MDU0969802.1 carbohydrate ABC transporter permease [Actinomycetaceae bacterium]
MAHADVKKPKAHKRKKAPAVPPPPKSLAPSGGQRAIAIIVAVLALIYFLFPIYWVIIASTKSNSDLTSTFGLWFAHFDWAGNYDKLMGWTKDLFWRWVLNSLIYSCVAGVVGTLLSVMAGYALAKFRFPGRSATLGIIMGGLLMPVALLTIPLYTMFQHVGLSNTMLSIIIPSCVSPFGVFLGWVYAQSSVPTELIEAARIDGASEARIFFTMVTRLLAPAMVTIFLFIFVATWNNFLLPLMMISTDSLKPVTLGLYGMMSYFAPAKGAVMLGALLGVIPLIILFLGLQRYWRAGLAAGSVKG